eukprot:202422_1
MSVIPRSVVCIYDENMTIPFGIEDIGSYLESKNVNALRLSIPRSHHLTEITDLLQQHIETMKINQGITTIRNVSCIVDRRHRDHDVLYIMHLKDDSISLDEPHIMKLNFVVSLRDLDHTVVECYLRYGGGETRFYPEYLTSIMPRFFKRNTQLNYAQNMDKLYDDWYKHGFAVDLNDAMFNKYYKMVTKFEHISVNYNRNIIKQKRDSNRIIGHN